MRALLVLAIACKGNSSTPVDAPVPADAPIVIDAPVDAPIDAGIDGPPPPACTGALYDPCTDSTQCMSMNCKTFIASMFSVCTQTCTPNDDSTCPTQNGATVQCNDKGICKPTAPNVCTL